MDNGHFCATNANAFQEREVAAYIATGREPHHKNWQSFLAELPEPPGEGASPKEKIAYQLQTEIGKAIYLSFAQMPVTCKNLMMNEGPAMSRLFGLGRLIQRLDQGENEECDALRR